MAEFQWWLLLVGLVAGGGLVAVVFLDGSRRDQEIDDAELPAEAHWIATRLATRDRPADSRFVEAVLREHREYRQLAPPDRLEPVDAVEAPGVPGRRERAASETARPEGAGPG